MRREKKKQNNKGFSIVELIIVVAIIAVLVAILAPAFMTYQEESRQKNDIETVAELIQAAGETYTNADWALSDSEAAATITLQKGASASISDMDLENAIKASGVDETGLKSGKWGTVTIKLTEGTEGALRADVTSDGDINMETKYIGK